MAGLGFITKNSQLQQLVIWGIAAQVLGAALGPYLDELRATLNTATPLGSLSPEIAAEAVIRNAWEPGRAGSEAARSGINAERFDVLVALAGNAPAPEALAVALRRKIIDPGDYMRGIRQGRLRDEWADTIRELAVQEPSPVEMLEAYLEGQIDEGEARAQFAKLGGAPEYFDVMYNTRGQAPTPVQALELANRGIIPWGGRGPGATSFEQAFLEGPWRNKWLAAFRELGEYLPPPRTVTAMYREGSLDRGQALRLLEKQGLSSELAAAYLRSASNQRTEQGRDLARSTITEAYRDRLVKRSDAADMLAGIGYSADEADFLLSIEDARLSARFMGLALSRVRSLYTGHRIDRDTAVDVLGELGLDQDAVGDVVGIWDWERAANVKALTPAEIVAAWRYTIFDEQTAIGELVDLGYTPHDAWVKLSLANKAPLGSEPPADAVGPPPGP